MKLSDVMSEANLAIYAEAALILFLIVFVCVALDLLLSARSYGQARLLPLQDERSGRTSHSKETTHGRE